MAEIEIVPVELKAGEGATGKIKIENDVIRDIFADLGRAGKSITERSNETAYQTDYYLGKEAVNRIVESVSRLDLPEDIHLGLQDLCEYLLKKIDKRIQADLTGGTLD